MGLRGWAEEAVWRRGQGLKGPRNERPNSLQTQPRSRLYLHRLSRKILLPSRTRTKSSPNSPSTDCFLLRVKATLHGLHRPEKRARDRRKPDDGALWLPRATKWRSLLVILPANQRLSPEAESVFHDFFDLIGYRMRKT